MKPKNIRKQLHENMLEGIRKEQRAYAATRPGGIKKLRRDVEYNYKLAHAQIKNDRKIGRKL